MDVWSQFFEVSKRKEHIEVHYCVAMAVAEKEFVIRAWNIVHVTEVCCIWTRVLLLFWLLSDIGWSVVLWFKLCNRWFRLVKRIACHSDSFGLLQVWFFLVVFIFALSVYMLQPSRSWNSCQNNEGFWYWYSDTITSDSDTMWLLSTFCTIALAVVAPLIVL